MLPVFAQLGFKQCSQPGIPNWSQFIHRGTRLPNRALECGTICPSSHQFSLPWYSIPVLPVDWVRFDVTAMALVTGIVTSVCPVMASSSPQPDILASLGYCLDQTGTTAAQLFSVPSRRKIYLTINAFRTPMGNQTTAPAALCRNP